MRVFAVNCTFKMFWNKCLIFRHDESLLVFRLKIQNITSIKMTLTTAVCKICHFEMQFRILLQK